MAVKFYAASEPFSLGGKPTLWLVKGPDGKPVDDQRFDTMRRAQRHADSLNALSTGPVKVIRT